MRKLLLSTVVLTSFSASIIIFQMSCQKTVDAQTTDNTSSSLNKTLISKSLRLQVGTKTDSSGNHPIYVTVGEYFLINNDGTNLTKINIPSLPAGEYPMAGLNSALLSNDGKKIIFQTPPVTIATATAIRFSGITLSACR